MHVNIYIYTCIFRFHLALQILLCTSLSFPIRSLRLHKALLHERFLSSMFVTVMSWPSNQINLDRKSIHFSLKISSRAHWHPSRVPEVPRNPPKLFLLQLLNHIRTLLSIDVCPKMFVFLCFLQDCF